MQLLDGRKMHCPFETKVSKEIRILAEVEKVWIIYDLDNSGSLDKEEVKDYIKFMAGAGNSMTDDQIDQVYDMIDIDNNGSIDKAEMETFLQVMMQQ